MSILLFTMYFTLLTFFFFFFNDTATTEIYTLSLHDALPIYIQSEDLVMKIYEGLLSSSKIRFQLFCLPLAVLIKKRSEEHTSELQSHSDLVCRLLLEKKKNKSSYSHMMLC